MKKTLSATVLGIMLTVATTSVAFAAQSSSSSYQVNEVFFGSGGQLNACSTGSTGYCAKESAGETTVGNTKSTNYQAQAGFNTDRTPYLQFIVNNASVDLGVLSAGAPQTATATFSVKAYLSDGYVVTTASDPPVNGSYTMKTITSPYTVDTSKEQFGINLAANNSCGSGLPASFGASPVQAPSSTFSFGAAQTGYDTACQFRYNKGDTIAYSSSSSGETDYTMSYLFNITNLTPGGTYTMNHVLVATATY
ncbi:MAG TPA: hypothetical protein VHD60_00355 [Candidatus Saccharimonadales bacterium]|nr:hypothetical protein [Candidatus Saccharimonadales bacterium]